MVVVKSAKLTIGNVRRRWMDNINVHVRDVN
jgi:hypothetical protein